MARERIDTAIRAALARITCDPAPPKLREALAYAVLPGGARVRPTLCHTVARACGDDRPTLSDNAAAALEFMHCASLVHDDLPCFDDADLRRGKPSVHCCFGEALAVLVGDALIVAAFETLSHGADSAPDRAIGLYRTLTRTVGSPHGISAGQAWESEPTVDLDAYHQSKTGALFVAATEMGAIAAGHEPEAWTELGARIGEAYQVADDLRDALFDEEELGKPVGQDSVHGRPNAVAELGVDGAIGKLNDSLEAAITSIPSCPGEAELCAIVRMQAERLVPVELLEGVR
ncbi:MAG: polyprenyl synthetase family protein [Pseudomonadota bacterium]